MIPYDDLVAALTAWRARQGLPVAGTVAAPPPPSAAAAAPVRGRSPAPPAPPATSRGAAVAPPAPDQLADFEEGSLVEESSYDSGEDYVMSLSAEHTGENTAVGAPPAPSNPRRDKRW